MPSPSQPNKPKLVVLVTGATGGLTRTALIPSNSLYLVGYLGATVLYRFLNFPDAQSKYQFRAVVRHAEKAKKLEEFGVRTVIGSHSDVEFMERETKEADIILAMVCRSFDLCSLLLGFDINANRT